MRTRLFALAATLSIAALLAAPFAGATVPSGGGGSSSGGGHAGGGGSGGGHSGGGGGGHFSGGGYRGGGSGGFAFHANMAHGGYVAHGSYLGGGSHSFARGGYRIIGSESAGVAHVSAVPQSSHSARITLALGPPTGSAATAMRLDRAVHADRMHPRPGHPPGPRHPRYLARYASFSSYMAQYPRGGIPFYCDNRMQQPPRSEPSSGCLTPVKEPAGRKLASAL